VQFLSRPDTYYVLTGIRGYGLGHIGDLIGGDLGNKYFPAPGILQGVQYQVHTFFKRNIEPGHIGVGDG
jgi:hypothetical protein